MVDLVVFDMAGTTVFDGDAVNATFRDTLAAWHLVLPPAVIDSVMGLPKPQAVRILLTHAGRPTTDAEVDALHAAFTERMIGYYRTAPDVREVPGAAAVFADLRAKGVKVALDTGFFRPIAGVLLDRLGWTAPAVVDATVTSDEVPNGRPHPDMIVHLMRQLGVTDPGRVAKVGDTQADMEQGTNAGCRFVVGVTTGSSTREQLERWPHTHVVTSVADVPALLFG
jgi:phosphonatase-like hydrolase